MQFDISQIKLIVGLGNVGSEYARTRHNAGFIFVDTLKEKLAPELNWQHDKNLKSDIIKTANQLFLAKPTTMMNLSGQAVSAIAGYYKIKPEEILLAHDDLDITIGEYKLHFGKGPKQHNGIDSVEQYLSTDQFWRLRIGIENREVKGNKGIPGMTFALQRFTPEEMNLLDHCLEEITNTFGI